MADKWRRLFPNAKRTKADFLLDGEAYFEAVIKAIESASSSSHYVYILGWMLDVDFQLKAGDSTKTLYKLLKAASEKGVEIRILVWDSLLPGYSKIHDDAIPRLNQLANTKAFTDAYTFFPESSKKALLKLKPYIVDIVKKYGVLLGFNPNQEMSSFFILKKLGFLLATQTLGAHHEKVVIVKGKVANEDRLVAFCGGIDFNQNRVYSSVQVFADDEDLDKRLQALADENDGKLPGLLRSYEKHSKRYRFPYYHDTACRLEGPGAYEVLQRFKRRWQQHSEASAESLLGESEAEPKEKVDPYPFATVVGTYNSVDGKIKDRSLSDAYFKIIENAKRYIYIEDQYLVNVDVAKALGKKLKESGFSKLILAIQDSTETSDIFIPNRKRGEFLTALFGGDFSAILGKDDSQKVVFALIDRATWDTDRYHPGMHAKTLIVDDEIAIIGSANVNQRSFTIDSETSVIVFNESTDDETKSTDNFARNFRVKTFEEFALKAASATSIRSWSKYASEIIKETPNFSRLVKYKADLQQDLDVRINDFIRANSVVVAIAAYELLGQDLTKTSVALSPFTITTVFDTLWEHFVDPSAP
jgi:phosphatidylserine/phosphatidylglycerophosphate/cardiolipin synthase-like enzyme